MALLFLDSCDLYATREQIARRWEPNGTSTSYINVSATAGRWGGRAIQLVSSGTGRIIRPIPPRQTVILAFAATALEVLVQPDSGARISSLVLEVVHSVQEGPPATNGATTDGGDHHRLMPPTSASQPAYRWRQSQGAVNVPRHIPCPAALASASSGSYSGRGNGSLPGQ